MNQPAIHEGQLLKEVLKYSPLGIKGVAEKLGWNRPRLYRVFEQVVIPPETKELIATAIDVATDTLLTPGTLHHVTQKNTNQAQIVTRTGDTARDWRTNKHGNRFEPLTDGMWRVYHKHVPIAAHAAYVAGWGDPEYTETLPEHSTIVAGVSEALFVSFTVTGSCQDDGSIKGIQEDMELTGESYPRSMWQYKLPFEPAVPGKKEPKIKAGDKDVELPTKGKRYPYWIIVDRQHGIQVAMIKSQDVEKGILHCCCRNPDKKAYPDFDINLDDCSQIFFVIKRVMND